MQRYVPLARARACRLNLIEFLPTTTAPFTATMQAASLFLLASVPFVAADPHPAYMAGWESGGSNGSCYDSSAQIAIRGVRPNIDLDPLICLSLDDVPR